jgi:hypothetical protein
MAQIDHGPKQERFFDLPESSRLEQLRREGETYVEGQLSLDGLGTTADCDRRLGHLESLAGTLDQFAEAQAAWNLEDEAFAGHVLAAAYEARQKTLPPGVNPRAYLGEVRRKVGRDLGAYFWYGEGDNSRHFHEGYERLSRHRVELAKHQARQDQSGDVGVETSWKHWHHLLVRQALEARFTRNPDVVPHLKDKIPLTKDARGEVSLDLSRLDRDRHEAFIAERYQQIVRHNAEIRRRPFGSSSQPSVPSDAQLQERLDDFWYVVEHPEQLRSAA